MKGLLPSCPASVTSQENVVDCFLDHLALSSRAVLLFALVVTIGQRTSTFRGSIPYIQYWGKYKEGGLLPLCLDCGVSKSGLVV